MTSACLVDLRLKIRMDLRVWTARWWKQLAAAKQVHSAANRCFVASNSTPLHPQRRRYSASVRGRQNSPLEAEQRLLSGALQLPADQLQECVRTCLQYGLIREIAASPNVVSAISARPQLLHDLCSACVASDMIEEAVTMLLLAQKPSDAFVHEIVNRVVINRMWSDQIREYDLALLPVMIKLIKKYPDHLTARPAIKRLASIAAEAGDLEMLDIILSKVVHQEDYRMQFSLQASLVPELSKSGDQKHAAMASRLLEQLTRLKVEEFTPWLANPIFRHRGLPAAILRLAAGQTPEQTALKWAHLLLPRMLTDPSFPHDADCLLILATRFSSGGLAELKSIASKASSNTEGSDVNELLARSTLAGFGHHDVSTEQNQFEAAIQMLFSKRGKGSMSSGMLRLLVAPGAAKWKYTALWQALDGELIAYFREAPDAFAALVENIQLEVPLERVFEAWQRLEEKGTMVRSPEVGSSRGWERLYATLLRKIRAHAPNVPLPMEQDYVADIINAAAQRRLQRSIALTRAISDHFESRGLGSSHLLDFVCEHQPVLDVASAALLHVARTFKAGPPDPNQLELVLKQIRSHKVGDDPDMFLPIAVYMIEVYQQGRIPADKMSSYFRCIEPLISDSKDFANLLDHLSVTASSLGHDSLMVAVIQQLFQYEWIPTPEYVEAIVKHCIEHGKVQAAWAAVELVMEKEQWSQLSVGLFAALLRAAAQASLWDETERIWRCYSEVHNRLPTSLTDQLDIRVAYVYYQFCRGELDTANEFTRKMLRNMEGMTAKQFMERLVSTIAPINWDFAAQVFYEMLKQHMIPDKEVFDTLMKGTKSNDREVRANFLKRQYAQQVAADREASRGLVEESSWEPTP